MRAWAGVRAPRKAKARLGSRRRVPGARFAPRPEGPRASEAVAVDVLVAVVVQPVPFTAPEVPGGPCPALLPLPEGVGEEAPDQVRPFGRATRSAVASRPAKGDLVLARPFGPSPAPNAVAAAGTRASVPRAVPRRRQAECSVLKSASILSI